MCFAASGFELECGFINYGFQIIFFVFSKNISNRKHVKACFYFPLYFEK